MGLSSFLNEFPLFDIRIKKPAFIKMPPPMVVFGFLLASYFLVTGGT